METQNDWRNHRELLRSNDSSTMSLDSDIEVYDPDNISAKPNESAKSDEPNNAKVNSNQNEPFKSAYGDTADLDNLRHLTVLFKPNNASLPAAHSDDESPCDDAHNLAKSRGARKRVGYQHYEHGQYEKQKQNSVSRKKRSKARKKKIDKAQYAALKTQELRDLNEQVLKSNEHRDFKNYGESKLDASQHTSIDQKVKPVTPSKKEPASPHVFELFAQLDHGTVPAELIEFFNRDTEDTSIAMSHDEYNARSAVYRSLLERYKTATGKLPASYSFELCKSFDAFYAFWDNCGRILEELHTLENDVNRSAFLESFHGAVTATHHHALSLSKLLKGFNTVRDFAKLPQSTGADLGADQTPLDNDTIRALDRFRRNLRHANKADINLVLNDIHDEFREDTTFKKFLAAFVVKLDQHMRLEEAEGRDQVAAHDARYSNIPTQTDADFDAAWDLAKSRGTRKQVGYHQHERDQHRQKKQNTQAKERTWQARKEKKQHAQVKARQIADTNEHLLKSHEYDSLKNEKTSEDENDDLVTELTQSVNSLSLNSENDSASSSSGEYEGETRPDHGRCFRCGEKVGTCSAVCFDYQECRNPECTYRMAQIYCKCSWGKARRETYRRNGDDISSATSGSENSEEWKVCSDYNGCPDEIARSCCRYAYEKRLRHAYAQLFGFDTFNDSDVPSSSDSETSSNSSGSCCGSSTSYSKDIVLGHANFLRMRDDNFKDLRADNQGLELIVLDERTFVGMSSEDYRRAQKQRNTRWVFSPESLTNFYFGTGFDISSPEASSSGSSTPSDTESSDSSTPSDIESDIEAETESGILDDNSFAPHITPEQFLSLFGNSIAQDGNLTLETLRDRFNAHLDTMDVGRGEEPAAMLLDFDTREHLNDLYFNLSQATDDDIDAALYDAGMKLFGNKEPLFSTYLIEFARELGRANKQAYTQDKLIRRQEERDQVAAHDARYSNIPTQTDADFDAAWKLSKSRGTRKRK